MEQLEPKPKDTAQRPTPVSESSPSNKKPTVIDVKFSLTKRNKILLGAGGLLALLIIIFSAIWFTDLKYSVLGVFFKAEAEVIVADSKTLQPIEGAIVTIDNRSEKTDRKGQVHLTNITLGRKRLKVTKEAYKNFERAEVIFIGLNKLKPVSLEGAGIPASFVVINKITKLPLVGAQVEVDENKVKTSKDGTAVVNVLPKGEVKAVAKISLSGYNSETTEFVVKEGGAPLNIELVPTGKNYFLSNRRGKIDLYESSLDGSGQKVILKATGNEESNTSINISPDNNWIALLSTRDGIKGSSGNLIPVLYLVNTKTRTLSKISSDPSITISGWLGDYLIYITNNGKYDETRKDNLISYNAATKGKVVLVSTKDNISPYLLSSSVIYSLPSKEAPVYGMFNVKPDGSSKKTIIKETVYSVYTPNNYSIVFQSADTNKWYSYNLNVGKLESLSSKPAGLKSLTLVSSPDDKRTAFTESRDGKRELYIADGQGNNEKKLTSIGSATYPIRWAGDSYIIFRSTTNEETADYIVGLAGGDLLKITDVYSPSYYGY